jgi:nucleoid-associated protein YgaU
MDYAVVPGDNLWVIAERQVHLGLGRDGTEAEVRGYWLALMDLNAPRMVEPGNPNLLLPGQVLQLPG